MPRPGWHDLLALTKRGEALLEGDLHPFMANLQSGVFYPPNLMFLLFPFRYALNSFILLHFILAALFMYAFLRNEVMERESALFGSVLYTFGGVTLSLVNLLPLSVLGVLLLFAGSQLALTVIDMKRRKDLFVVLAMLGITLSTNLAAGFIAGIAIAYALKSDRMTI